MEDAKNEWLLLTRGKHDFIVVRGDTFKMVRLKVYRR